MATRWLPQWGEYIAEITKTAREGGTRQWTFQAAIALPVKNQNRLAGVLPLQWTHSHTLLPVYAGGT